MRGMHLALAMSAGNFAIFAVIFCMAVSATSETHGGFTYVFGLALFLPEVYPSSDLTLLLGTILLVGDGFGEGVHHVCPPSGWG